MVDIEIATKTKMGKLYNKNMEKTIVKVIGTNKLFSSPKW